MRTALPPDVAKGVPRAECVVLSRAAATVLAEALGGDITVGTANAFPTGLGGHARQFAVHARMADGTSRARRLRAACHPMHDEVGRAGLEPATEGS